LLLVGRALVLVELNDLALGGTLWLAFLDATQVLATPACAASSAECVLVYRRHPSENGSNVGSKAEAAR
jgi:hypothetical protein